MESINIEKNIVGVGEIKITDLDDTLYISTSSSIGEGTINSLAFYTDSSNLNSTGASLYYDSEYEKLYAKNLYAHNLTLGFADIEDFFKTSKHSVSEWVGFESTLEENCQPFKLAILENKELARDELCLITNDYEGSKQQTALKFTNDRLHVYTKFNMKNTTIDNAVGCHGDKKGDIAVDEDFIYYCTLNFNGEDKIWKRVPLESW